ncbi:MAG TPA: hypothetical protein VHW90_02705 [Stellaceae bacterium]|nr:hypothetical protein [Stellaceae bacterium]
MKLVDVKAARVDNHFMSSDRWYVDLDMRDGSTREDIQRVSKDAAEERRAEIIASMQRAWDEIDPFDDGYKAGVAAGYWEGHRVGLEEGRSQGYQSGLDSGFRDGRQSVISHLLERRENFIMQQGYGEQLSPSKRRYLRNAISILTEVIQYFSY